MEKYIERTQLSKDSVVDVIERREDKETVEEREEEKPGIKLSGPATACELEYTRAILKHFLFRRRAGLEVDEDVAAHLENANCRSCQREVIALESEEPFLFDENFRLPSPHIDVIKPERAETGDEESLTIAELAEKLVYLLKTPAKSFSLKELAKMYDSVRSVKDTKKRRAIVDQVKDVCRKRWDRVAVDGAPTIQDAVAKLLTHIKTPGDEETINTQLHLGLEADKSADFLNCLMTKDFFFNLHGDPTWEEVDSHQNLAKATPDADFSTINLNLPALRQALALEAEQSVVPVHG